MIPDSYLTGLELNPVQLYKLRDALKREQQLCEAVIITPASKYFFSNLKNVNLPE